MQNCGFFEFRKPIFAFFIDFDPDKLIIIKA